MRITTKNYFKAISEVGFENLPDTLKKSHLLIEERTDNGNDWSIYEHDSEVKRVFDLVFEKLFEFIDKKEDLSGTEIIETNETMEQESTLAEKFVKRFLLLNGKTLQKKEIEGFLNEVQNAIKEREITKDSVLSNEVLLIQSKLLTTVNNMGRSIQVELAADTKRKLQFALNKLKAKPKPHKQKKETLNGTEKLEVVDSKQNLMNSIDFAKLHFNSIGFSGKWLNLIGDPSPGFTAMVFGRPKMGKSYLCVDFAGYLARNHGAVLYVANEEKLDATLQMKLNDKDVKHENLFVSDYLPEDLSKFQFIILDSVNKLGLSPQDLENLKRKNPGKSFIFIFQTTKDGKFKGANSYQHDVDVVIEVPERGRATQFGRFNQGGEMSIFDDAPVGEMEELNGVRKSRKNLEVPKKVSNVDTMKKKTTKTIDWTEPEHLNKADHSILKEINRLYKAKKYKEAMNRAMETDTIVREEIPGDIWKRMGGQLTKTGEEKLRSKQGKASPEVNTSKKPKQTIVFNSTVRALKGVIEREWDLELTDGEYIEILDIAQEQSVNFYEVVTEIHPNLTAFMTQMAMALKIWDKTTGKSEEKSKEKFDPKFYANRKDDDNPRFIFGLTSSRLLSEAIKGDFDLIYLVRRELANRGQDSNGKWIGFDEAKKIHRL
jgi:hypothetical protein